jgi:hypothetical protein
LQFAVIGRLTLKSAVNEPHLSRNVD